VHTENKLSTLNQLKDPEHEWAERSSASTLSVHDGTPRDGRLFERIGGEYNKHESY
jgi:hypothetical protein